MSLIFRICIAWLPLIVVSGCTKVSPAEDGFVSRSVETKLSSYVHWNQGGEEDELVRQAVHRLLSDELTVSAAVQVALICNPEIQAHFEEIGIAQAEVVQAGLFQNPVFSGFVGFPLHNGLHINTQCGVAQSFLDVFLIPLRQKIAATAFERVRVDVAGRIFGLAADVKEAFYTLQMEQAKHAYLEQLVAVCEAAHELAAGQSECGNISELKRQLRTVDLLEAKQQLETSQSELVRLRERLAQLLGSNSSFTICQQAPLIPEEPIPFDRLQAIALFERLDLASIRLKVQEVAQTLGITQWWTYSEGGLGVSSERDTEGNRSIGPTLSLALPFFDHGQAARARLLSLFRQQKEELRALEITVRLQVDGAKDRVRLARERVERYISQILPLQDHILSMSQRYYNVMTLSVFSLLDAKQGQLHRQIEHAESVKDYWISKVALDRALGVDLTVFLARGDS